MEITVNGDSRSFEAGTTVQDLLEVLDLRSEIVVVQRNNDIVERAQFAETTLTGGDVIEIVRLVGGG